MPAESNEIAERVSRPGAVASVARALEIIDAVGERGTATLAELATKTGLPKSTLYRLLSTISAGGYLERNERGEYVPTVKLWRIGARAIDYTRIHSEVVAILDSLVSRTSETAHFSIYEDGHAVYVEKVEGTHPIHAYTHVGGRSPAYASATGKALLAYQPSDEIERVARSARRHTAVTIVSSAELVAEAARVRETNIAVNRGEWRDGVWGVAAAVFGHRGDVIGAIGLSGPQNRFEPAIDDLAELVREGAATASERHGDTGRHAGLTRRAEAI